MSSTNLKWRPIPGWPAYEVSDRGDVRRIATGRHIKPMRQKDGRHLYFFPKRGKRVYIHRAVLLAFVGPPGSGEECRHLDGKPENNRPTNLAWGTKFDQRADDRRNGVQPRRHHRLTEKQVAEIRQQWGTVSSRKLASIYGVSHTTIRFAALALRYRDVEEKAVG